MPIMIDLRLTGVSMELHTLKTHIGLVEEQIRLGEGGCRAGLQKQMSGIELRRRGREGICLGHERDYQIHFVLPRVLRVPFLVTLFTVYEAAVTEIAGLVQKKKGIQISVDDLKGGILDRARKYYGSVLQLELSKSNRHWQRISLLSDLRNAIAHTNGRLDLVSSNRKRKILQITGGQRIPGLCRG